MSNRRHTASSTPPRIIAAITFSAVGFVFSAGTLHAQTPHQATPCRAEAERLDKSLQVIAERLANKTHRKAEEREREIFTALAELRDIDALQAHLKCLNEQTPDYR